MPPLDSTAEACPSGRRGTPGERVGGQPPRGFESRGLRRSDDHARGRWVPGTYARCRLTLAFPPGRIAGPSRVWLQARTRPGEGRPPVKRSAGTVLMAIAWLVLLLPGVNAQEAGLSVTPLDGETVTAATLVDELVGAGVETSDETYTTALQASGLFSGGTGIIGFESGVLLTSGDVGNVVGPNAVRQHRHGSRGRARGRRPERPRRRGGGDGGRRGARVHLRPGRDHRNLPLRVRLRRVQRVRVPGIQRRIRLLRERPELRNGSRPRGPRSDPSGVDRHRQRWEP